MRFEKFFRGHIVIEPVESTSFCPIIHPYQYRPLRRQQLGEQLMHKFRQIKFNRHECRLLSRDLRKIIYTLQNVELSFLREEVARLQRHVARQANSACTIKARGFGAIICLAAMFEQVFPKDQKIEFWLEEIPWAILPKKLYRRKRAPHYSIKFDNSATWLQDFTTLQKMPKELQQFQLGDVSGERALAKAA